jgi:dTDP-4-dehydrorhamnose reductase
MAIPARVWVVGGTGLLGRAVVRALTARGAVVRADGRKTCDVADAARVRAVMDDVRPRLVVNCAGFTRVDACETHGQDAVAVNTIGAGHVAEAAQLAGARLIHISTDYVFDAAGGDVKQSSPRRPYREDDPPGPSQRLCVYGRSKLDGEAAVRRGHPAALIVRTAWLFGHGGPCFPRAILDQARAGGPLRVVNDQTGSPTYVEDLAEAIAQLVDLEADRTLASEPGVGRGLIHVTNAGHCTWHAFACELLRLAGIDAAVEPISTAQAGRPARRPTWSVLDGTRFERLTGRRLRPWQAAAAAYVGST